MPLYFAYGSNMSSARLAARCPGARFRATASLPGYALCFDKLREDGSGVADVVESAGGAALGVLYELSAAELAVLDGYEGGYRRIELEVVLLPQQTERVAAQLYVVEQRFAAGPDPALYLPARSYKAYLVDGAREHGLPPDYIRSLERITTRSGV